MIVGQPSALDGDDVEQTDRRDGGVRVTAATDVHRRRQLDGRRGVGVADLGHLGAAGQHGPHELADEHGVVAAVVDVAGPEHRVLHLAHQRRRRRPRGVRGGTSSAPGRSPSRARCARRGPARRPAVGVVEAEGAECLEPVGAAGVPRLGRQPAGHQLQLRGDQLGGVDDGHRSHATTSAGAWRMGETRPVIIVSGTFEVDPARRDEFLAERHERMRTSRAEAGCLEYTFSADPLDPGRVLLFERWEVRPSSMPTSPARPARRRRWRRAGTRSRSTTWSASAPRR